MAQKSLSTSIEKFGKIESRSWCDKMMFQEVIRSMTKTRNWRSTLENKIKIGSQSQLTGQAETLYK